MSELMTTALPAPLPLPMTNVTVRSGTLADVPFMDALQKLHTKQVGWMPRATFEGKIRLGHVLIAEEEVVESGDLEVESRKEADGATPASFCNSPLSTSNSPLRRPVGYLIGNDQYFKRDDVGIVYQMNVLPGRQRGLIGATLLKAQFERSAYGCKLYCCWCAQDIAANRFWEAMGFVPLAFRAGSEKKSRTHIFWQKRIRQGDVTTPWWFPSKTAGGSIREDRIVLPIPPGTHWSDAKPMIFPELPATTPTKALPGPKRTAAKKVEPVETPPAVRRNGLMFAIPQPDEPLPETIKPAKPPKPKTEKTKRVCDPRLVSAARELRDRWLEQINAAPLLAGGKYEVSRRIATGPRVEVIEPKLLAA